jgi:hypothetical protein
LKKLHAIGKCSLVKRIKPRNEVIARTIISFTFLLFVLKYGGGGDDDDDDDDEMTAITTMTLVTTSRNVWRKRNVGRFLLHVSCKCSISLSFLCTSSRLSHLSADIRDMNPQDRLQL